MDSSSILATLYLCCEGKSFWLKNMIGLLSSKLLTICANHSGKIGIVQDYFFGKSSLYVIKRFLMDLVPVPGYLFGSFCYWDFCLTHSSTNEVRGASMLLHLAQRSWYYCIMPRKCLNCFTPLDSSIMIIAYTLLLWGFIPSLVSMYPRYSISSAQNVNFSPF